MLYAFGRIFDNAQRYVELFLLDLRDGYVEAHDVKLACSLLDQFGDATHIDMLQSVLMSHKEQMEQIGVQEAEAAFEQPKFE